MQPMLISHLTLRKAVGYAAMLLPIVLLALAGPQPSLSAYHGTAARDVFVIVLGFIAAFLITYRGHESRDTIASRTAGLCAATVALAPHDHPQLAHLHLIAATGLLLTLAYMSWALFTLTDPDATPTHQKLARNAIYRTCAVVMLACLGLILLGGSLFWLEAAAIEAMGVAWFVKGEGMLADDPAP